MTELQQSRATHMTYHVMCYSNQFKEPFIGTTVKSLKNIFNQVDEFFGTTIHKEES